MAINPLTLSSNNNAVTSETLGLLLRQLPILTNLPGKLEQLQNSSLLTILNNLGPSQKSTLAKQITIPLPGFKLPFQNPLDTSIAVTVKLIETDPIVKLQLYLQQAAKSKNNLQKNTVTGSNISQNKSTSGDIEIQINQQLKLSIKILSQKLINSKKFPAEKTTTESRQTLNKVKNQPVKTINSSRAKVIQTKLATVQQQNLMIKNLANPVATNFWPQHGAIEKLSQTLLISKLLQLNQQLSNQIKDPYVKVLNKWIKQLVSSANETKLKSSSENSNNEKVNTETLLKAIKNNGALWESFLKKESSVTTAVSSSTKTLSPPNIKAQLLRIIQSLPILLSRLDPAISTQFVTDDTQIWLMVSKIKQLLSLQSQTSIPTPSSQQQPDLMLNWLEQNLRLITDWLRNIEHQQAETLHQTNQQSSQQTHLRFELPMPSQHNQQPVEVEIDQQQHQKNSKKNQWKWQLKMSFNFGEGKRLLTKTKLNEKQLGVTFEGSDYFKIKLSTGSMLQLEKSLNKKTGLETSVKFISIKTSQQQNSNNKFHLEI